MRGVQAGLVSPDGEFKEAGLLRIGEGPRTYCMKIVIAPWERGFGEEALDEIAGLWNRNAGSRHAFFPSTGALLRREWLAGGMVSTSRLLEARLDGRLVGFAHFSWMREHGYPHAGVVEAILVDAEFRGKGVGTTLLARGIEALRGIEPGLAFVDALGAWPCGFLYTCLADGSERSGVFSGEPALASLFFRAGFREARRSLVMRAPAVASGRVPPPGIGVRVSRRGSDTWLDRVFRARECWDHDLADRRGDVLSRAIYGHMPGESLAEGRTLFSLFGVNTPTHCRRRGWAEHNIGLLLGHVAGLGCDCVELHVYTDNVPALALYRRTGFTEIADTAMMHLPL